MPRRKSVKKSRTKIIDVLVIGGGSAGISSALTAKSRGKSVILVEKDKLGGECPNYACIPTKAMITTAKAYYLAKNEYPMYGVSATELGYSFSKAMQYKRAVVNTITGNGQRLGKVLLENEVELIMGSATFVDPHTVKVGSNKIKAKSIVIATGVVDNPPPVDGLDTVPYLTYKDVVALKSQPRSVAIIGGGPVGTEFATFFSMIGTKVHLFEIAPHILSFEDEEIAMLAMDQMKKDGVNLFASSKVLSVKKLGAKVELVYQVKDETRAKVVVDKLIIAAGKKSNIDGLNIQKAKVKIDDRDRVVINKKLQTSQKHIFVAGDMTWGMQLTHTAHRDGEIAGWNVSSTQRKIKSVDNRVVPRATFAHHEIASVGITAKEANDKNLKIDIRSFPVGALGRAVAENKRKGLLKVVLDKKTGKVLGAQMIGERSGEVIHELALAMHLNVKFVKLESMLHAFPTYSEAIAAL
ncbi:NAD(P)/FAD-dependent oxidoreductase [Candidatus Uhrbacteria bacterium]|jgi:pyruvate/2-oxoglutarate dehydrogenase complex dihydrolipoamide dehydrogenase (E3) component|nr:NAD(P)/FAD-dependent oxidoreductase [Candidatus Uhrbacteria bacterium]MBT7717681.1 NAD(P)/FAD-dependent oxidoreductase [Candidatus Uhrbacteria bacterium]